MIIIFFIPIIIAKYEKGLHVIIAGDHNRINVIPILDRSHSLTQTVDIPTRTNPDSTLEFFSRNYETG